MKENWCEGNHLSHVARCPSSCFGKWHLLQAREQADSLAAGPGAGPTLFLSPAWKLIHSTRACAAAVSLPLSFDTFSLPGPLPGTHSSLSELQRHFQSPFWARLPAGHCTMGTQNGRLVCILLSLRQSMSLEHGGVWLKGTWAEHDSKTAPSPWVSCVLRARAHSAAAGAASAARGEDPEACVTGLLVFIHL